MAAMIKELARLDDAALVEEIVHGNMREQAFTVLYGRYHSKLLEFIASLVYDRHISEDLVQETFLKVIRYIRIFNADRAKFSTWIYTIATNVAMNEKRDRYRRERVVISENVLQSRKECILDMPDPDERVRPDYCLEEAEISEILDTALSVIRTEHREAVELFRRDYTYDEIALISHCPVGTVKSRLFRAKMELREEVSQRMQKKQKTA